MDPLEIGTVVALAMLLVPFIIFRLEPRIPIAVGLGLLVGCAVMVALGKGTVANQIAVYAYYSLVAGVILIWVQQVRQPQRLNGRMTYDIAKVAQRRSEIRSMEIFRTIDQMTRAKNVQDELRQRLQSWSGTEHLRTWQEEKIQILDASVIICWFSEEPSTAKALEVRQKILDGQVKAVIPDFGLSQVIHALRRNPRLSYDDVVAAVKSVKDMCLVAALSQFNLNKKAPKLASKYKIDVYSAFSLALANELGADFVTADRGLYERIRHLKFVRFLGRVDES